MKARRRYLVVAGSVLVHCGLLVLLVRPPAGAPRAAQLGVMTVSLDDGRSLAALVAPPRPPRKAMAPPSSEAKAVLKPPQPSDVAPQFVDVSSAAPDTSPRDPRQDPVADSVAAAASGASGQVCRLSEWLQQALQADPQVQAALLVIPRPARSVSNALMLWDGGWVAAQAGAAPGVAALRAAVVSGIQAAPAACQAELVRGPELMTLASGSDTTVVAVGSGEWRWGDLLSPAPGPAATVAIVPAR